MKGIVFILLFVSSFLYTPTSRTKDDLSCGQYDPMKEDCGYAGITQQQCEENNCCYAESSTSGIPWCFKGIEDIPSYYTRDSSKRCEIYRENRVDCGYKGIKKEECESRDCCFKIDDYESIVPWCFYGVDETKRVEIQDEFSYVESGE